MGLLGSWQWHCQCLKVKVWVKLREESLFKLFLNNQYKHAVHSARIALATYSGSFRQLRIGFYAAQNSACGWFFEARFSFSPAFEGHIWEIIIGRAEKGCCMNHERWSVCQSPAGCTTLGILCSRSVIWRGFIQDLKQLNECNSLTANGFYLPRLQSSVSLSLQSTVLLLFPHAHNHGLVQNEQKVAALRSACHPLVETGNSLEFMELEAGRTHVTPLMPQFIWIVDIHACSSVSLKLTSEKKGKIKRKRKDKPTAFRGIRNQFQEMLPTLMVKAATESKCILVCVCIGPSFLLNFLET